MPHLNVLIDGAPMGRLDRSAKGTLTFDYDAGWRDAEGAFPLSQSLPLTAPRHSGKTVENFLWNLLPDNPDLLRAWGREFNVSAGNVFALLSMMGADCAGAVQFVGDDWLTEPEEPTVEWIDDAAIAAMLRNMQGGRTRAQSGTEIRGRFSLAGAQPKQALYGRDGAWGIARGSLATTHIIKPSVAGYETVANEHACLRLAYHLGLTAAQSAVAHFEDQRAVVVTRYDRAFDEETNEVVRYHQEDFCQATGTPPSKKYENEGGPSAERIGQILRETTEPEIDLRQFLSALVFNFAIMGTDAHAKNYSLMHLYGRRTRLAPLYDVISFLPYTGIGDIPTEKMSMKIGGHYRFGHILRRHWHRLSNALQVDVDWIDTELDRQFRAIPNAMQTVLAESRDRGLEDPMLERMAELLVVRCDTLRGAYR